MTPSNIENKEKLLTGEEVAAWMNLRLPTVYEHARNKVLPSIRIGRLVRFRKSDIEKFIAEGGKSLEAGWRRGES